MPNVLVGISGGIAVYKIASVVSVLVNKGHNVKVIMTEHAKEFVTPLTFATLSKNPVIDNSSEWGNVSTIPHIDLSQNWADIFVIAPATANVMAKFVNGIADDVLTATYLAAKLTLPILIFPAMNTVMWDKEQTQKNVSILRDRNSHKVIEPAEGKLACGAIGVGKLPSTKTIIDTIMSAISGGV